MSEKKDGEVAFPIIEQFRAEKVSAHYGMSLRDVFAGLALTGLCSLDGSINHVKEQAFYAYRMADAMIEARKRI